MGTRELIREFNLAFGRPVNESWTHVSVSDRELLGKLLLEEVLEYCQKGLGLTIIADIPATDARYGVEVSNVSVEYVEGRRLDPVEVVDGLADVNVVAHFAAHWHGFNLDKATEIVNESNMSKLGEDGKPIINGESDGYRGGEAWLDHADANEEGFDPTKPVGKILKGPNFREPHEELRRLIMEGDNR